jgi:hypothetical protein
MLRVFASEYARQARAYVGSFIPHRYKHGDTSAWREVLRHFPGWSTFPSFEIYPNDENIRTSKDGGNYYEHNGLQSSKKLGNHQEKLR